ncbi:MAG: GAF domain-containing protein [Lachnospiraceae bacterium]|nr:GAF domain-containing protein [Lachnospiraceae bacterium]
MFDVNKILEMSISLTAEHDYNKILEKTVTCAMELTNCEGGTLYLFRENRLEFMIMRNIDPEVQRRGGTVPPLELDETKVCAYSAIHRELVNVPDVYAENTGFDFSGPKEYDKVFGCHTKSMLAFPLINHEEKLIGVAQLLNARNPEGELISFTAEHETLIRALASMAAVSLSNMQYVSQIKQLLHSIVNVFTNAIDARTPYNYYHSRHVHDLVVDFMDYCNEKPEKAGIGLQFDAEHREELELTAMMHDIGKLVTPLEVMNKETRLAGRLETVLARLRYIRALKRIAYLEGSCTKEEYEAEADYIAEMLELIQQINAAGFLEDETIAKIKRLAEREYEDTDGERYSYITKEETVCLMIKKGTLTEDEREIMKQHVVFTERFLSAMNFDEHYKNVRTWASLHHELLNGSGYPGGLTEKDLPFEVRLITVADVYDALTSDDRPYKKPHSREAAFAILGHMADDGQIDGKVLSVFKKAVLWKEAEKNNGKEAKK